MKAPKNIEELGVSLMEQYAAVLESPKNMAQARLATKIAETELKRVQVQLNAAALFNEEPDIAFLGKRTGIPLQAASISHRLKV